MYGLCLQYASSEEDAQDILQDGFVKVFQKIDQLKDPRAFPGWIRRLMINTALEKYRSKAALQWKEQETGDVGEPVTDDTLEALDAEVIMKLIQQLTPKYRMVFNLYAIEGYSHQEIAEMLGISEGTSKSNLSRARGILQEKVRKVYGNIEMR